MHVIQNVKYEEASLDIEFFYLFLLQCNNEVFFSNIFPSISLKWYNAGLLVVSCAPHKDDCQ